jgi:CRP/FNR family transcriptional regulator, cyclic AMP receptor protein
MSTLAEILKETDIFDQLTATQLEMVANICSEERFSAGQVIFEESSNSKELYVIVRGEVEILISPTTGAPAKDKHQIAVLRHGQSFGEVALVDEGLRSATARATQKDTRLLVIARDKFLMLCETYPQLGYRAMGNLAADLATKIRNADMKIRDRLLYLPPPK